MSLNGNLIQRLSACLKDWLVLLAICSFILPACSSQPDRPKIGLAAPDFAYESWDGSRKELSRFRGKVVLIRFWAGWCRYCRKEMPVIEEYYQENKDKGFTVLAVNFKQSRADVETFVRELDLSYPVGLDLDGRLTRLYDVKGIPTHFLIDREGILRNVYLGPMVDKNLLARFLSPYL